MHLGIIPFLLIDTAYVRPRRSRISGIFPQDPKQRSFGPENAMNVQATRSVLPMQRNRLSMPENQDIHQFF